MTVINFAVALAVPRLTRRFGNAIHLAFYAGWPKAMSALTVAKQVFEGADQ